MPTDPERCELLCLDLPKAEALRSTRLPADQLEQLAQAAKGLGDPTRLAIAIALRDGEEACVCDLGWVLGRDEKLVSHHLRQLKKVHMFLAKYLIHLHLHLPWVLSSVCGGLSNKSIICKLTIVPHV